jgi:ectoine hydroxylase-related dioxygenase (phytanoyl-CoA dioxygenase family)
MDFTELSLEERAFFEQNGYLIVRNALPQEQVERLIDAGDRLIGSDSKRGRQTLDGGRYDCFRNCIALDPAFLELHTSHLIYKGADAAADTGRRSPGWHRDINTCPSDLGHHATPRLEVKICYQLSDASRPGCGQTLLAPGSHRLRGELPRDDQGDPAEIIEPLLAPGDALLFENRTWHAGGHNRSGYTRKSVMFGYSYRWMRPDDYIMQENELLARCTAIQRQLLGGLGGLFAEDGSFHAMGTDRPLDDWCAKYGIGSAWERADLETLHAL